MRTTAAAEWIRGTWGTLEEVFRARRRPVASGDQPSAGSGGPVGGERPGAGEHTMYAGLRDRGYVTVDLLDEVELQEVRAVRNRLGVAPGDPRTGLFNDTWSTDTGYKRAVSEAMDRVFAPAVQRVLPDHRSLGFVHIVKWPGEAGDVVAHRDPTFVDEDRFRSMMVWCALDDVTVETGALWVVPGSHRAATGVRGHQCEENLYPEVSADRPRYAVPLELRAGSAVLYDHALVHTSGPNRSSDERVAIAGVLVPDSAAPRYAVPNGPAELSTVAIDEQFFIDHRLSHLDPDAVAASCAPLGTAVRRARPPVEPLAPPPPARRG